MGLLTATLVSLVLLFGCVAALAVGLLLFGKLFRPRRQAIAGRATYESGVDPIHDARRRFDIRFQLLAIAFLVFDVELLFLYPWAVASHPSMQLKSATAAATISPTTDAHGPHDSKTSGIEKPTDARPLLSDSHHMPHKGNNASIAFPGMLAFFGLLAAGFVYDWRKGMFEWR